MKEATDKIANTASQTPAKSSLYETIKRVLRESESFQAWLYELRLKRFKSKKEEEEYLKEVFKQFNFTWEARKGDADYREPTTDEPI